MKSKSSEHPGVSEEMFTRQNFFHLDSVWTLFVSPQMRLDLTQQECGVCNTVLKSWWDEAVQSSTILMKLHVVFVFLTSGGSGQSSWMCSFTLCQVFLHHDHWTAASQGCLPRLCKQQQRRPKPKTKSTVEAKKDIFLVFGCEPFIFIRRHPMMKIVPVSSDGEGICNTFSIPCRWASRFHQLIVIVFVNLHLYLVGLSIGTASVLFSTYELSDIDTRAIGPKEFCEYVLRNSCQLFWIQLNKYTS